MTWEDFSYDEKKAVLKSAIVMTDGNPNYSQNQYLTVLLMRMDVDMSIVGEANSMWKMTMNRTLRNMTAEKKDVVVSIWYDLACRSMGGEFSSAVSSFSYFPEYAKRAKEIASDCNITLKY